MNIKLYESAGFKIDKEVIIRPSTPGYLMKRDNDMNNSIKQTSEFCETALTQKEISQLGDSEFGLPIERKYPLCDKTHILQAVRFFGYAKPDEKKTLANNIIKKAKEFNIDYTKWESIKPYYESYMKEDNKMENVFIIEASIIDNDKPIIDRFGELNTYFQEASQSRKSTERRNVQKNLKKLDYDKDTKTIKTIDYDGKERRVNFKINDYEKGKGTISVGSRDTDHYDNNDSSVNMTLKTLKSNPKQYAQPMIQHELNHDWQNNRRHVDDKLFDKEVFIHNYANQFIKKHWDDLTSHDRNANELDSDARAALRCGFNNTIRQKQLVIKNFYSTIHLMRKSAIKSDKTTYEDAMINSRDDFYWENHCSSMVKEIRDNIHQLMKGILLMKKSWGDVFNKSEIDEMTKDLIADLNKYKADLDSFYRHSHMKDSGNEHRTATKITSIKNHLNETLKLKDAEFSKIGEILKKSTNIRIQFLRELKVALKEYTKTSNIDPNYKHPKSIIKEYLIEFFDDNDYVFEEYMIDDVTDQIYSEEFHEECEDAHKVQKKLNRERNDIKMENKKIHSRFDIEDNDFTFDTDINKFDIGNDDSDIQNDYDEKDVEYLNMLIASESSAMAEYFEGSKNTDDENLRSLYADIGAEERFHSEQLMYAKSILTGEKYEPRDPDVKKEYQEMISKGMDEETALNTVVDKHNIGRLNEVSDDMEELEDEIDIVEYSLDSVLANMDMIDIICEYDNPSVEIQSSIDMFMETHIYSEAVDNVADKSTFNNTTSNPIKLIWHGIQAIIKYAKKLINIIKTFLRKYKLKHSRRSAWLKNHSIKDIFARGISLYFYSDSPSSISKAPEQYMDLLNRLTIDIARNLKLNNNPARYVQTNRQTTPINYGNNIAKGIDIVNGIILTKTKVIVNDNNEEMLKRIFFGYNDGNKVANADSLNYYNLLTDLIDTMTYLADNTDKIFTEIKGLEGNVQSIYYADRKAYNSYISYMKSIMNGFGKFLKALSYDLNTIIKLDDGMIGDTTDKDKEYRAKNNIPERARYSDNINNKNNANNPSSTFEH